MTPAEVFEEKKDLVFYAIKGRFGSLSKAKIIAEMNNMEFDDLVQVGRITLWDLCLNSTIEKVKDFDPYAVQAMKWAISREIHQKGKNIRVPSHVTKEEREKFSFHSIDLHHDGEIVNDFFAVSPINVEEEAMSLVGLQEILSVLNEREKFVVTQKILGFTDKEIAKKIGKCPNSVGYIKNKAYKKINPDYKPNRKTSFTTHYTRDCKKTKNHLRQQVI